jgi:hypothetical protein
MEFTPNFVSAKLRNNRLPLIPQEFNTARFPGLLGS